METKNGLTYIPHLGIFLSKTYGVLSADFIHRLYGVKNSLLAYDAYRELWCLIASVMRDDWRLFPIPVTDIQEYFDYLARYDEFVGGKTYRQRYVECIEALGVSNNWWGI